ncbi:MAG: 30S ribosomal protein S2 [Coriobacteriia bacterium]|nr:30S ribosomal protein S2 [Coriobacteriia bacterium]
MIEPVTIRSLLDAAVHFGHQTRRWNPKMKPYIFGERNGIYIIDLKQTMVSLDQAYTFTQQIAANGGTVLFVGTKKQAQEPIATNAERCEMPYVNHRWLGGMLTNYVTIHSRVSYMEELESMEADGRMAALPKKEQIRLRKELSKLQANLNGIRYMKAIPQLIFIVDTMRETIAIREARQLGIPVVGIIDTNSDPDDVDYGIPGNDDAIRSVNLITEVIAEAVLTGAKRGSVSEAEILEASGPLNPPIEPPVSFEPPAEPSPPMASDLIEVISVPEAADVPAADAEIETAVVPEAPKSGGEEQAEVEAPTETQGVISGEAASSDENTSNIETNSDEEAI